MKTRQELETEVIKEITKAGGAAQFHYMNNLCLTVINENQLAKVINCPITPETPFGVKSVPYRPSKATLTRILKECTLDERFRSASKAHQQA